MVHAQTTIQDPTGAAKVFFNNWNTSTLWTVGLLSAYESRLSPSVSGPRHEDFSWAQDGGNNPFISQDKTTLDQGTSNQRVSMVTNSLDAYGNATSSSVYDYDQYSPTLSRTIASTYLHSVNGNAAYDNAFIRNRVLTNSITPAGGTALTMLTNTYDQYATYPYYRGLVTDAPFMVQHDSSIDTSVTLRGNVTNAVTPSGTTGSIYDTEGNVV